ncbi:MAG: HD domain-containing protein [Gammaproteobacteria bacterium]
MGKRGNALESRSLFFLQDIPPPASPLLAGFCSVCDWLGSNAEFGFLSTKKNTRLADWERAEIVAPHLGPCPQTGRTICGNPPAQFSYCKEFGLMRQTRKY